MAKRKKVTYTSRGKGEPKKVSFMTQLHLRDNNEIDNKNKNLLLISFIMFLIGFAVATIGFYFITTYALNGKVCGEIAMDSDEFLKLIHIPDRDFVTSFCIEKGYKYGWLSSVGCGKNEVTCYKNIGNAEYFDCIKVNE